LGEATVAALSCFQEKRNETREQLVADRFALVLEPTLKCRRKIRLVVAEYGANLIERGEPIQRRRVEDSYHRGRVQLQHLGREVNIRRGHFDRDAEPAHLAEPPSLTDRSRSPVDWRHTEIRDG